MAPEGIIYVKKAYNIIVFINESIVLSVKMLNFAA